jgi:mannosyltransferase
VALAAALCAYGLSDRSMWLDEGATYAIVSQHGVALWHAIAHDGGNMLVYYLLMHVLVDLFGAGEVVLRLPSVIADAVTAGLTVVLGLRLLGGRAAALAAGLLSAVSLPLVFWGQDARGYAAMATLATASMLALLMLVDSGSRRPWGPAVAYVVTLVLALYVGFDAVLVVPAQLLIVYSARRERLRLLIGCLVVAAVICIPLAVLAVDRGSSQLFWVAPLKWSGVWQALVTLTSAGMPPNFHHIWVRLPLAILTLLAVIAAAVLRRRTLFFGRADAGGADGGHVPSMPLVWLLVPAVLAGLAAWIGEPLELPRLAVLLMPALALVLAGLLLPGAPGSAVSRRPRVLGAVLIVVLIALRAVVLVPSYGVSPEPWQSVAARLQASSRAQPACIAFYPQDGRMAFGYYIHRGGGAPGLTPVLPTEPWSVVKPHVEQYSAGDPSLWHGIAARCTRLFVVASHQGQKSVPGPSRSNYYGYRRLLTGLRRLYPHASTHTYGYAAAIRVTLFKR